MSEAGQLTAEVPFLPCGYCCVDFAGCPVSTISVSRYPDKSGFFQSYWASSRFPESSMKFPDFP